MERNRHSKDVKFLQQIAWGIFVRLCFYWRGNLLTTIVALSAKQTPRGRAEAAQGHQQPEGEIQPRTGAGHWVQAAWLRAQGWTEPCGVKAGGWRRAGCWKAVLLSGRGCLGFEMVFIQSFGLRLSPPLRFIQTRMSLQWVSVCQAVFSNRSKRS